MKGGKMNREVVTLTGNQKLATTNRTDAFGIRKGRARIFINCSKVGDPLNGRNFLLCEMLEGEVFPSLSFVDEKKLLWNFIIMSAEDEVKLERIPYAATNKIKQNLLTYAGVPNGEIEGYEYSIRSFCRIKEINEDIQILINKQNESSYGINQSYYDPDPLKSAFQYICKKWKYPFPNTLPAHTIFSVEEAAEKLHLICRKVRLERNWFKKDCGLLIGTVNDNPVALVPSAFGYIMFDTKTKKEIRVGKKEAETMEAYAYLVQRALPNKQINSKELFSFVWNSIETPKILQITLWGLIGTLVGMLLPILNQKVYDDYIPMGDFSMLLTMCTLIGAFVLGNITFSLVKKLLEFRVARCAGNALQDAMFRRVFDLPELFFHGIDSGDLTKRLCLFDSVATQITSNIVGAGMTAVLSIIYLIQMATYSKTLALWSYLLLFVFLIISYAISKQTIQHESLIQQQDGKANGKLLQYIEGVAKLRLAGAANKAIAHYVAIFINGQVSTILSKKIAELGNEISKASSTIITMVLYYLVYRMIVNNSQQTSIGTFIAFFSALGSFSAAMDGMIYAFLSQHHLKPTLQMLKPIWESEPENTLNIQKAVPNLNGKIDIQNLSFAYSSKGKKILSNMNLTIQPGEYVGIVGESGCGKSTLLKLLLGFVQPIEGRILYDGFDLSTLDIRIVRRQIGSVLQNGKLFDGTIYENVALGADSPNLKMVQEAIRSAGLEGDINSMPMGINTILNSANETVSGGQRQRILIARALCGDPAILMFDEATSALDNPTQDIVCKSLEVRKATRIIIAHRLSTIQHCDRIIVMKDGHIVQQGNYTELMQDKKGYFFHLASRQLAKS